MGKKLVSRTAKVLSETKRKGGKEAIAIAYEHIPRNPEEQRHGSLYAVIELEDTGGHAEEIAERIIDILHDVYYENTERSSLSSFESALAKINEELADRSSEGQINWLGKLNAVLGVLSDSTLHLSQSGKADGYLYRGDHSLHITEDLSGDSINPARTFINVASGDLAEKDKVVLVTPGIFYKLSKNELKKYVNESSPKTAAENISQLLASETGANIPNALLLMEMVSPEAFIVEPEPEATTETWIKDERNVMEPVAEQTLAGTAKAFEILGRAASGASTFIASKAVPLVKEKGQSLASNLKSFQKEKRAEQVILESEESLTRDLEPEGVLENVRESSLGEIRIKENNNKPKILSSLERFDLRKKTAGFGRSLPKIALPKGKNSILYIVAGIVLAGSLVGFLIYNNNIGQAKKASENKFAQAKTKYEEALEVLETDRTLAMTDLESASKLASEVKSGKYNVDEATSLLKEIESAKDRAMGTIRNTAKELTNLPGNANALFTDDDNVYALNFETGSVYSVTPAGKVTTLIENAELDGPIKFATFVKSRNVFSVYTENKSIYEISVRTKRATKQRVSGSLENAIAADSYLTSIYLLSPENNTIYKHLKSGSGYGRGVEYFKTDVSIGSAIDFAIDSDVYVLSNSGEVQKYTSGQPQDFQIKNLPTTLSGFKDIYTSPEVKGLYMADATKIVKIDENQNYVGQYVSEEIKNIQGMTAIGSTLFLQSEGRIYTISF